jgi:glycine cleavage system H lipoate-binding protein
LQGYDVAPMLFYHPAHVWARIEEQGIVRVGLDDFGQKLAGRVYSVQLPPAGTTVGRGAHCWRVTHHAGETVRAL